MGNRKTFLMKNFKLTEIEWELYKKLRLPRDTPWNFSEVIREGLALLVNLSEPDGMSNQFLRINRACLVQAHQLLDEFKELQKRSETIVPVSTVPPAAKSPRPGRGRLRPEPSLPGDSGPSKNGHTPKKTGKTKTKKSKKG